MAKEALSALLSKSEAENQLYLGFIFVDSANVYHVGGIQQGGMLSIFTPELYDRAYWALYNSGQDVRGIAAVLVTHYSKMPGIPETLASPERVAAHKERIELYVATPSGRVVNYDGVTTQIRNVGYIRP